MKENSINLWVLFLFVILGSSVINRANAMDEEVENMKNSQGQPGGIARYVQNAKSNGMADNQTNSKNLNQVATKMQRNEKLNVGHGYGTVKEPQSFFLPNNNIVPTPISINDHFDDESLEDYPDLRSKKEKQYDEEVYDFGKRNYPKSSTHKGEYTSSDSDS